LKKLYQRIDRLRGSGLAMLNVQSTSPYAHLNGNKFKISSIGVPGIKCPVTLEIDGKEIDFTIEEVE